MVYTRKTKDEFNILGFYSSYGWECVTSEETRIEAKQRLKEYRENETNTSFKLQVKRVLI